MPNRPRPLLAVRLIGPTDVVTAQKADLLARLAATFGERATCRSSTHPASHSNEIRVYITVTGREAQSG
jgi:hypothetical protein